MSLSNTNILASQRVGFSTKPKVGSKLQILDGNRFRRVITVNNSGSALTSALIAVPIDHRGIYETDRLDKHTTRTFNDLRVYAADQTTPISFYLEGIDTHSCALFVRLDIASGDNTFLIEYGNPALPALSDPTVVPSTIVDDSTIVHNYNANHITSGAEVFKTADGSPTMNLHNTGRAGSISDVYNDAPFAPTYNQTSANGMAALDFDGVNDTLGTGSTYNYTSTVNPDAISIYLVSKAATLANYTSAYRNQATSYVVYPFGSTAQFIVSSDGGIAGGVSSGIVANTWNITSAHYKKNTTNGMRTYRNNTIVAQRNSVNVNMPHNLRLWIGSLNGSSEYFNGEIAQMIVCYNDNFSNASQTQHRDHIYEYLNAKYKQYGGLENLTITVGSEIEIFKNVNDENIYEFSNIGKQAWQDKVLDIELDTAALISAGRMRSDCGDIRVFDEKGNALPYFILQPNTAKTKIVFKVPEIEAGETFRIKLTYNIPGRASGENRAAVVPSFLEDSNALLALDSTDYTAGAWVNRAGDDLENATAAEQPTLVSDQLNGLPVVRFDGSNDWLTTSDGVLELNSNTELSVFIVAKANGAQGLQSITNWEGSEFVLFPIGGAGAFWHSDQSSGTNTSYSTGQFTIIGARYNADTGTTETFRDFKQADKKTLNIGQTFPTNDTFKMGKRNYGGELTNADVASVFVTSSEMTDAQIQELKEYYAALYHFYDEVWLTYSLVSSDQDVINTGYTYEYYSGVAQYDINSKIDGDIGGVAESTADITVKNVFDTTLIGSLTEHYSDSTLSTAMMTNTALERTLTVTDSGITDRSKVGYHRKLGNAGSFALWPVYDDVDATKYKTNADDYFTVVMNVEDASLIDYDNSTIRLYNDNTISSTVTDWTVANEWGQAEFNIADPFGGSNALKYTPTANGGFIKFLDEQVDPIGFTGTRTISVYVRLTTANNIRLIAYGSGFAGAVVDDCDTSKVGQWQRLTVTTDNVTNYRAIALWGEPAWPSSAGPIEIFAPTSVSGTVDASIQGSCDYIANIPTLVDGINYIKIKKSEFVGSGSYDQIDAMEITLQTLSGTQDVQYSQARFEKNYNAETKYQEGSLVDITLASSSDNRANWDILPITNQVIDKVYIGEETELKTIDYLSLMAGVRFKDLPSFHGENMILRYSDLAANQAHRYMVHELLSMVFPSNFIDTATLDGDVSTLRYSYLGINKDDYVVDTIKAIVGANLGLLYFDPSTSKITYKSGTEIFGQSETAVDAVIQYENDTNDKKLMFNRLEAQSLISLVNNASALIPRNYLGGFGGSGYEIRSHIAPFEFDKVRIPLVDILPDPDAFVYAQRAEITGILFSTSPAGDTFNNTNIVIRSCDIVDSHLEMNITNLSGSVQYLVAISVAGQYMVYASGQNDLNPDIRNIYEVTRPSSIDKIGQSTYSTDPRFIQHDFITNTWDSMYSDFFDSFGNKDRYMIFRAVKKNNINVGELVSVLDRNKNTVTGLVVEVDQDKEFAQTVKIREL